MSEENIDKNENKSIQSGEETIREKRIINAVINTNIILMSTLMCGFTEMIVNATGAMASEMAEAIGDENAGEEINQEVKQKLPEVNDKMRAMMSNTRKNIYSQIERKRKEIEPFLSDPVFDAGPKKIDE